MAEESDSLFKKFEEILAYPAAVDESEDEEDANEAALEAEDLKEKLHDETGADMDAMEEG